MRFLPVGVLLPAMLVASLLGQDQSSQPVPPVPPEGPAPVAPAAAQCAEQGRAGGNRVFGVLPNYRTADVSQVGTVLTNRAKFDIATKDSFDYPLVALAGAFAGLGQLTDQQPSFGQGLKGYGHRLVTNYGDQAMGNMFTEGGYPVLLHEDPRYFRLGTRSTWWRIGYALTPV